MTGSGRRPQVFAASVMHETHCFSRAITDLAAFRRREYLLGDDIARVNRGTRTLWGAVFDVAGREGWDVVHPLSANAVPSGSTLRPVYEEFCRIILESLATRRWDGILLILHGAMVCEGVDDAEGELLQRVRDVAGPDVPIAITLDPHANVTALMATHANILVAYRTTPHVDLYETAERALALLARTMRGEIQPRVFLARKPMLDLDNARTDRPGPTREVLALAAEAERDEPGVLCASLQTGFPWSDVAEMGTTVAITGDGCQARYYEIAERLADAAWQRRAIWTIRLASIAEVVAEARAHRGPKPLVIGDYTDCAGGGAASDGTALLRALIEADVEDAVVGLINDADVVRQGRAAGIGARLRATLGGKADPRFGGAPLTLEGRVSAISDGSFVRKGPRATGAPGSIGDAIVLDVGSVRIAVNSRPFPVEDRENFRCLGIDPERVRVLACKAMNHFRADFEPIADRLIYVDSGGLCSTDYALFPYRKLRRPVAPLDFA